MERYLKGVPKWVWWSLAALIAFQIYLFRELVAAELLFAVGFAILLILVTAIYAIVVAADRGVGWIEANSQGVTQRARQQWNHLETLSRKLSRRQHSESAP
jgi:Mg2+/citrate symporter